MKNKLTDEQEEAIFDILLEFHLEMKFNGMPEHYKKLLEKDQAFRNDVKSAHKGYLNKS